jgi:hypothetical protein
LDLSNRVTSASTTRNPPASTAKSLTLVPAAVLGQAVLGRAAGVKAGLAQLMKGNRPSVERATLDEEMFI